MTMESTTILPRPSAPATPEHAPSTISHPGVRRVHTLPAKLAPPQLDTVETLFVHSEAKVVSFNVAAVVGTRPGSSAGRRRTLEGDASGTLAWSSPSERTLAAGPLRIYRVPSSGVSFLNSGLLLHPILQRSQCWCVDEQSLFVLRVREGTFYRIELPFVTEANKSAVEEFKKVLATVLQYEKTSSPFRRGYVAEVAEAPKTPARKTSKPREKAKKWRLNKVWEPEDPEHRARLSPASKDEIDPSSWRASLRPRALTTTSGGSGNSHESTEDEGSLTGSSVAEESQDEQQEEVAEVHKSPSSAHTGSPQTPRTFMLPLRPRPLQPRSVTAPPHLMLETNSTKPLSSLSRIEDRDSDAESMMSNDSFYSAHGSSFIADEPAIAADTDHHTEDALEEHSSTIKRTNHQRGVSEITITPSTPSHRNASSLHSEDARDRSNPSTPTLISDSDDENDLPFSDAVTPPDTLRLQRLPHPQRRTSGTSYQQALQPLPPPNHFFTAKPPSRKKALSAALVQKAYSLLIGPPSHLVAMMLEIATKIMKGIRWHGGDERRRVPGGWESSADEDEWGEDEDDFGIPLDNVKKEARRESRVVVGDEEESDYDALVEGPRVGSGSARSSDSID